MAEAQRPSYASRAMSTLKLVSVEPFTFLCLFGYIVRGVSFQSLLMDRACRNMYDYTDDMCDHIESYPDKQAQSTIGGNNLYTGVMLTSCLPSVVVAIFLGPWADKYSRKYPILLAVSGMFAESLISTILVVFPHVSPWMYVLASLLNGMTGGVAILGSFCCSYLSDITDASTRSTRFAVLEFVNMLSVLLGGFLGGQVFQLYGYLTVMSLSPISYFIAIIYAIVLIKDTKPKIGAGKRMEAIRDLFSLDNIKQSYRTCTKRRHGNMRLQIWLLVWVSCAQKLSDMGFLAVAFPFARNMYQWGVTAFSNANIAFTLSRAVVTVVVVPVLSSRLMLHEIAIGLVGVLSSLAKLVFMTVAYRVYIFYFANVSGSLASAVGISVKSRLSKLVHKDELGRAFSFLGTFESLTPLFGTAFYLQIYNASVHTFPGLAFAASALLIVPSVIIYVWMMGMPTISLGEFGRDEEEPATSSENILPASKYQKLEKEKY